jgi:hypothetical protein
MRWLIVRRLLALVTVAFASMLAAPENSAANNELFVNDFENPGDDTAAGGWFFTGSVPIVRTRSGYVSPDNYASGILSAHGDWHARLKSSQVPDSLGPANDLGTPINPTFPPGGYVTEIDIYLDVEWTQTKSDRRFDWSSAISNTTGTHQRDFVFNVGTDLAGLQPGFFVNASTNATRGGAFPQNPCPNPPSLPPANACRTPVHITQSGWYTFRHRFYSVDIIGVPFLAVDFTVIRHSDNTVVASWTISGTDPMATTGGDLYGWFVIEEIPDLAADCLVRRPPAFGHPPLHAPCRFPVKALNQANGGGQINVTGGRASFGFNAKQDTQSGHLNYINHVTRKHLDCKVMEVMISSGTAQFSGTCSANSDADSFKAEVEDIKEPGKGADKFKITYPATGGTTEGDTIRSGNIQIR